MEPAALPPAGAPPPPLPRSTTALLSLCLLGRGREGGSERPCACRFSPNSLRTEACFDCASAAQEIFTSLDDFEAFFSACDISDGAVDEAEKLVADAEFRSDVRGPSPPLSPSLSTLSPSLSTLSPSRCTLSPSLSTLSPSLSPLSPSLCACVLAVMHASLWEARVRG